MSSHDAQLPDYTVQAAEFLISSLPYSQSSAQNAQAVRGFVESLGGNFDYLNREDNDLLGSVYVAALLVRYMRRRELDDKK